MIPKKIHYIWLGGKPKSNFSNICINSWYEKLGYEYVRTITDGEYQGNLREKKLQVSTT